MVETEGEWLRVNLDYVEEEEEEEQEEEDDDDDDEDEEEEVRVLLTHPPTHPPSHRLQQLIRTGLISSTFP